MFLNLSNHQIAETIAQRECALTYTPWHSHAEREEIEDEIRELRATLGLREARAYRRVMGRNEARVR